jgi:hypothetical protein
MCFQRCSTIVQVLAYACSATRLWRDMCTNFGDSRLKHKIFKDRDSHIGHFRNIATILVTKKRERGGGDETQLACTRKSHNVQIF